jgi:hypothetical protein
MCRYVSRGMLSKMKMLPMEFLDFLDTNKTKSRIPYLQNIRNDGKEDLSRFLLTSTEVIAPVTVLYRVV